jgi:tetratricopeptide (TPR) repeat protein
MGFAVNVMSPGEFRTLGLSHFHARRYEEAIDALRKYLRKYPRDYGMWNILGVAYYHTGQPRKALRYLKHVERKTSEKSYNYYYQGLCYIASEEFDRAREYFAFIASRYQDEYASRATFELAVLEYKLRNSPRSQYWLNRYMQLFPNGVYMGMAQQMLQSLREFRWLESVEGAAAPNQEEALFKYNKLSLGQNQHYWFFQSGFLMVNQSGKEPTPPPGSLKSSGSALYAGQFTGGIGLGPSKLGTVSAFAGYTYRQNWFTDLDRISEYSEDFADIQYFPLRSDLLEREHQLYADFRRQLHPLLYIGLFSRIEIKRAGSGLLPAVDNDSLKMVTNVSQTQLLIPWAGFSFSSNLRSLLYLYWRKELNQSTPEFSNKTYEFGLSGQSPVLSLGISGEWDIPDYQLNLGLDLFQYEFIYNDPWLDYTRRGAIFNGQHEFLPRWFVQGLFGLYQDSYQIPRFKRVRCDGSKAGGKDSGNNAPNICARQDTGLLFSATLYWNYTQFHRFGIQVEQVDNQNPQQKEFETGTMAIKGNFTMAFPSVKRTVRYVDRFADTAFTKENE